MSAAALWSRWPQAPGVHRKSTGGAGGESGERAVLTKRL
jgi:hypothetical protein